MTFIKAALLATTAAFTALPAAGAAAAHGTTFIERAARAESEVNKPYNEILATYLTAKDSIHLFDYAGVTPADKAKLSAYIATLEALRPSEMNQAEQIAYYANIYNAKTLEIILDNYPVKSIRDIGGNFIQKGPWRDKVLTIEGEALSLDNVEHDIVRERFDEPRVHYAFNCASIGCPNLAMTAWEAATLDADLDAAGQAFVAHPRGISVDDRGRVTASSIYKWFKGDFGNNDAEVLDHIRQYATGDRLETLKGVSKINKYEYDWSLNQK